MHDSKKMGFWGLSALVFGLMVGVGIFNLPQNMAYNSAVGPVILSWLITAAGMLTLVYAFKKLTDLYPQFKAGIYEYAQAGFGSYSGFNAAWGYWLCSAFSNVAYAVMLNDACGAFFPQLLDHGWLTVLFGSFFIWVMYFIVAAGIQTAQIINTTLAVIKVFLLLGIICIFVSQFDASLFNIDFWGSQDTVGSVGLQIKDSMMVTLFCFFGVEGAVMMSARAKKQSDVGKAGYMGFVASWILYLGISVLCFGLMPRAELANLPDPSSAYILKHVLGHWAYYFVVISIIIALIGGWVAWTLVVAQVPYEAAKVKILPKKFLSTNRNGMPTFGLFASSVAMEVFLLIVVMADNVYLAALHITSLMILPCYLFTALFLWQKAPNTKVRVIAFISTIFCLWMIYAGGVELMLMTSIFYIAGLWFYITARKENRREDFLLSARAKIEIILLSVASAASIALIAVNGVKL